jgi:hypothetical protein
VIDNIMRDHLRCLRGNQSLVPRHTHAYRYGLFQVSIQPRFEMTGAWETIQNKTCAEDEEHKLQTDHNALSQELVRLCNQGLDALRGRSINSQERRGQQIASGTGG